MMYTEEHINAIIPSAVKFVEENDRASFIPFLRAVEEYASENGLAFSGDICIYLLLGQAPPYNTPPWELLSTTPEESARGIAERLVSVHTQVGGGSPSPSTTAYSADIRGREFSISVNMRTLVRVVYIPAITAEIIGFSARQATHTGVTIRCVPEEVSLIRVYRNLYSIGQFDNWGRYLQEASSLHEVMNLYIREKLGAGKNNSTAFRLPSLPHWVLIGDHAMYLRGEKNKLGRLQFLAEESPEECAEVLSKLYARKITFRKQPTYLVDDFQLVKHTYYNDTVSIADGYNSLRYEVVPIDRVEAGGEYLVGSTPVLLRFKMLDLWIARILEKKGVKITGHIAGLIKDVNTLSKALKGDAFSWGYLGTYLNESVQKKKIVRKARGPIVYPALQRTT